MNNIFTDIYKFDRSKYSLNEPIFYYVWAPPTSDIKCAVNKKNSRNKLHCILKGNNTTVHQVDLMVNNVTDFSVYDSGFLPNIK